MPSVKPFGCYVVRCSKTGGKNESQNVQRVSGLPFRLRRHRKEDKQMAV